MKTINKKILMTILCLCIAAVMCISSAAAADITINYTYGSVSGFSHHIEYTTYGVRGSSEGDIAHSASDKVSYYASVDGLSNHKHLYAHLDYISRSTIVLADITQEGAIATGSEITFNRGYDADIVMEEHAFTGVDTWSATYTYYWRYSSSQSRMTITSGKYTGTGTVM